MTTLNKTWVDSINQTYSSAVDQAVQYRESFFGLKQLVVAAGAVIEASSNGSVADASDNLASAADCIYGTAGSQPLAYFVARFPTGYGNPNGAQFRLLVVANNANSDTTPQTIDIYAAYGTYSLAGTPTQNRPTTAASEVSRTGITLIPWTAATTGYFSTWRTSDGDIIFAVKDSSTDLFDVAILVNAESSGIGSNTAMVYAVSGSTSLTSGLANGSNWRAFNDSGTAIVTGFAVQNSMWGAASWTNGHEGALGYLVATEIDLMTSSAGASGRYFGRWSDVRGNPPGIAFNQRDSTDTDTQILRCAGYVMLPVTRASGAFL